MTTRTSSPRLRQLHTDAPGVMKRLVGVPAAPGILRGPWVRVDPAIIEPGGSIKPGQIADEAQRLRDATEGAATELEAIARKVTADGHVEEAAIFLAQASIARDPALLTAAIDRVKEASVDGVAAIQAAAESFAKQLRSLDDELLAARAADVIDVGRRIARRLAGAPDRSGEVLKEPAIVVAEDLPPSVTATLPRSRLLGIALQGSSPTAHAAILARAYGIPAVVGVHDLLETLGADREGGRARELVLDGDSGAIVIDPDERTRRHVDRARRNERRRHDSDVAEAGQPAVTLDGTEVALLANIGTPDESKQAIELGARGVGLFRTEFLFLERASPPSEAEQIAAYQQAIAAFAPREVTIRLLDVGGDKPIPYLPIAPEANPFLGVRALRLAYSDASVFMTQLRACYQAATVGSLKVMAPMIADATDVALFLTLAERARDELATEGRRIGEVRLGVMLEVPAAILVADSYFERIAFASLGTNDLLQYTLAVDRGNAELQRYRDPLHPGVLQLIRSAVAAAARTSIGLSVCGEMAGDPAAALALTGLGLRSLSMAASNLAAVKRAIRGVRLTDVQAAANAALTEGSAPAVRARFERLLAHGAPS